MTFKQLSLLALRQTRHNSNIAAVAKVLGLPPAVWNCLKRGLLVSLIVLIQLEQPTSFLSSLEEAGHPRNDWAVNVILNASHIAIKY